MKTLSPTADDLIGTYRTFGEFGPVYQVVRKANDKEVHIMVIESGEELDYPVDQAIHDPEAQ